MDGREGTGVDGVLERLIERGSNARRHVLGVSVALPEADDHWRGFLAIRVTSGPCVLAFNISYGRTGLRVMSSGNAQQRCEFRSVQNSIRRVPDLETGKRIGGELHASWSADTLAQAEVALARPVASNRSSAPKLAMWLKEYVPENLAVFSLVKSRRRRLRTSSPIERIIWQKLKCRTAQLRAFLSESSLLRMVHAILTEMTINVPQSPGPTSSGDAKLRDVLYEKFQTSGCSIRQRQYNAI